MFTLSQGLFSVPWSASEKMHRKLGGSLAGTGALNWPKGNSTPQNVLPSIWTGEITWKEEADGGSGTSLALVSRGWAIVLSSLVLLGFYLLLSLSCLLVTTLLQLSNHFDLNMSSILFSFLILLAIPWWGGMWGVSEWLYGAWYNQTVSSRKKKAHLKLLSRVQHENKEDKPPKLCCMQHC